MWFSYCYCWCKGDRPGWWVYGQGGRLLLRQDTQHEGGGHPGAFPEVE